MSTTSSLPAPLAKAHAWARRQPWLARFTLMNRLLLAMAFLPTGLVKATGQRFTVIPVDDPIGFFFEAMYQTGPYWRFIGLAQVAAALFMLIPGTATVGALLFLPIGVSILLITWGVGFGATTYVAAGMLLSVVYLLCWDGDRLWAAGTQLLGRRSSPRLLEGANRVERIGWLLGGAVGIALLMTTRGFLSAGNRLGLFAIGGGAALLVVAGWVTSMVSGRRT